MASSPLKKMISRHKWNRLIVGFVIVSVSAILGAFVYIAIYDYVTTVSRHLFISTTTQMYTLLGDGLTNNYLASQTLSETFGSFCPTLESWPNCSIPFKAFKRIANPLLKIGLLRDIGLAPILYPYKTAPSFEVYAYNLFKTDGYPKNYGIYSAELGPAIYKRDPVTNAVSHDTTGKTDFSPHEIIVPNFECPTNFAAPMFNLHSEYYRGKAIDKVMQFFYEGRRNESAITPLIQLVTDPIRRPASLLVYPVAPAKNTSILVGFIRFIHNWDTILTKSAPPSAAGVDIIIGDGTQHLTFTVRSDATVVFQGDGDLHDPEYNDYRRDYEASGIPGYSEYSFVFYPNSSFFPSNMKLYAVLGCTAFFIVVFLLILLFAVYHFSLHRQLMHKQEALDSKRSFVRFISHEIRTPLNTVCMGLKVLQDEARTVIEDVQSSGSIHSTVLMTDAKSDDDVWSPSTGQNYQQLVTFLVNKQVTWLELMKEIEVSSSNAVNVLNELISYDKIEMNTLQIEKELLPIWELLSSSVKPFYIQARERGLQMQLLMPSESISSFVVDADEEAAVVVGHSEQQRLLESLVVVGDPIRLAQVFRNLISNALKFSFPGTTVYIKATWHAEQLIDAGRKMAKEVVGVDSLIPAGSVRISVEDSGPGLSAENLAQLFKEGVQFNANKLQAGGGSGLGLFIAKGIVLLHCGLISAQSAGINKGATFIVELPVVRKKVVDVTEANESSGGLDDIKKPLQSHQTIEISESCHESKKVTVRRVLVVDDAASNRKMLCRILVNCGCVCVEADDGSTCITTLMDKTSDPNVDLILLDFEMPVMKGPDAAAEIRRLGFKQIIIGVTGNVMQEDVIHFLECGAHAVLSKPLSMEKLQGALKKLGVIQIGNHELA